jgi:hypothetical protein
MLLVLAIGLAEAAEPNVTATARIPATFQGRMWDDGAAGEQDLDGDGRPEQWWIAADSGSGMGGATVRVVPGAGGEALVFEFTGSFGDFLLPAQAPRGASLALTTGVAQLLLGAGARRTLDPASTTRIDSSFRWLVDRDSGVDADPRPFFSSSGHFTSTWTAGSPSLPDSQYVVAGTAPTAAAPVPGPPWVVVYFAHNHHVLQPVGACGGAELWRTDHGLIRYDRAKDRHAWIWVTTHVTKLRWASIGTAVCAQGLVLFGLDRGLGEQAVVVVDPVSGRWGELPLADTGDGPVAWAVRGGSLVRGVERLTLADLKIAVNPSP